MPTAPNQDFATARRATRIEHGAVLQGNRRAGDGDATTRPLLGGDAHRARYFDGGGSFEQNPAARMHDGTRIERTRIANHPRRQRIEALGGNEDAPTRREHRLAILHEGRDLRRRDEELRERARRIKIQGDDLTRRKRHCAGFGDNQTGVADLRREQGDIPTELRANLTFVDDGAHGAGTRERESTRQEILVGERMRGHHERTDVDARGRPKEHAVRVQEQDRAVGGELTKDRAGVAPEHAIEGRRTRRRLTELHRCFAPDIKRIPVDDRAVALLRDDHFAGRRLRNGRHARLDDPTLRQRRRGRLREEPSGQQRGRRHEHGAREHAAARHQKLMAAVSHQRFRWRLPSWSSPVGDGLGLSLRRRDHTARQTEPAGPCQARLTPPPW